jgi:pSer/pThr/pTyr-binding forkhead associated (FHA) protein
LDLTERPVVIGSSPICDVVVADRFVSRRHARIHVDGNLISVIDLQSRNGTTINGRPISDEPTNLYPGDCIELASGRVVARIISNHATEPLPKGTVFGSRPDSLSISPDSRCIVFDGKAIPMELSARQWALLERLCATKSRPVSVPVLKQTGWPRVPRSAVSDVSLRTQLSRVRSVLRRATNGDVTVAYVQGAGYLLS